MQDPSPSAKPHHLEVLLVPGLFSPRWLLVPMKRYLDRRFVKATVWDHPNALGELDCNLEALRNRLCRVESRLPLAIVTHSFGDWIIRDLIAREASRRPTHLVSIAPIVTANAAAIAAGKVIGDCVDEIAVMRDADRASANLKIPNAIRHLVLWPKFDCWIRTASYRSSQTIEQSIWATHNSAPMQPGVMRKVEQFLRCQTVDRTAAKSSLKVVYPTASSPVATRSALEVKVAEPASH